MIGTNFMDEIDCGSFFDHIDDLLDFPNEDVEAGLPNADSNSFPSIWPTQSDSLPGSDSVFSNSSTDLSTQLSVPVSLLLSYFFQFFFFFALFCFESQPLNSFTMTSHLVAYCCHLAYRID